MCDPGLLGRHFQEVDELLQLSRGGEEERQRGGELVQLCHNEYDDDHHHCGDYRNHHDHCHNEDSK